MYKLKPTILIQNTFSFNNAYDTNSYNVNYIYDVELLILNDFRGKNSVIHTKEFKQFLVEEHSKEEFKKYDTDINIRDLYPIKIHYENKILCRIVFFILFCRKLERRARTGHFRPAAANQTL